MATAVNFAGTWNAASGSAPSASPVQGSYWIVTTPGTTSLGGNPSVGSLSSWNIGDWAVFDGTYWEYVSGGAFLQTGSGAITRTVQGKLAETVSAKDFGAVGDGVADDTAALRTFFNYVVANGLRGYLGNCRYKITSPLLINASVPFGNSSFVIEGDMPLYAANQGCEITLYGSGFTQVLEFGANGASQSAIRNLALSCNTAPSTDTYAATYGIYFTSTDFTGMLFENIVVNNVRWAIGVAAGSGANGEFGFFKRVNAQLTQGFYQAQSGTGQGFCPLFEKCGWLAYTSTGSSSYTAFQIGDGNGGYGMHVIDFDASVEGNSATSTIPVTLYNDLGSTSPVLFKGGRIEGFTTALYNQHGSSGATASFQGIDFAGVLSSATYPFIRGASINAVSSLYTFRECIIPLQTGFYVAPDPSDSSAYFFERCRISAYNSSSAVPFYVSPGRQSNAEVRFSDCTWRRFNVSPYEILNRSYRYEGYPAAIAPLLTPNTSEPGVPQNLLVYPDFGGAAPPAPWWVVSGGPFSAWQTSGNNVWGAFSSSPSARYIIMPAGMTAYQDVVAIGGPSQFLYWLSAIAVSSGNTTARLMVSLSNSVTGEVYDTVELGSSLPSAVPYFLQRISLSARSSSTMAGGSYGKFRLSWSVVGVTTGAIGIYLGWQLCSQYPQAGFVFPAAGNTQSLSLPWQSSDALRVFGRFALPYKDDTTGSGAAGLPDLSSDIYISNVSNQLTYYSNALWNRLPNQDTGTAIPVSGTYPAGWIRWNSSPAAGGTIGWVCISAGSPGTWKTFGAISS